MFHLQRMKLVDLLFVQEHYRTRRELFENPEIKEPEIDSFFKSEKFVHLSALVKTAAEDALKVSILAKFIILMPSTRRVRRAKIQLI